MNQLEKTCTKPSSPGAECVEQIEQINRKLDDIVVFLNGSLSGVLMQDRDIVEESEVSESLPDFPPVFADIRCYLGATENALSRIEKIISRVRV